MFRGELISEKMFFYPFSTTLFGHQPEPWIGDIMAEVILVEGVLVFVGHVYRVASRA